MAKEQLTLSKGALALFSVGYLLLGAIGAFGWRELSGFRHDANAQFREVHEDIETIAVQQAVLSERLDNTRELQSEVNNLHTEVTNLRLELAEMKNPNR